MGLLSTMWWDAFGKRIVRASAPGKSKAKFDKGNLTQLVNANALPFLVLAASEQCRKQKLPAANTQSQHHPQYQFRLSAAS